MNKLIFRQLFDLDSSTYTYLLGDTGSGEAVIIDSVFEQSRRDRALLDELDLKLVQVLDTHCHADHVTGAWLLKEYTGCAINVSEASGIEGADHYLQHGQAVHFGEHHLQARATPGHTNGCMTFVLDDKTMAFTGDALLIRGCGRTDFQQGSAASLYRSIHEQIFSLPDNTELYPGHDYRGLMVSTVAEEKKFNSRLGGNIAEADFAGYMDNLGLPHPNKLDIAVPANLKCGRPDGDVLPSSEPAWAPLRFTFGGIWEVDANWVGDNLKNIQIVDVREQDEFDGPLGHIANARLIPLGELRERCTELEKSPPIVTVCRSGARSSQATVILNKAGFTQVANLHGGMLHWHDQHHPVAGVLPETDYQI